MSKWDAWPTSEPIEPNQDLAASILEWASQLLAVQGAEIFLHDPRTDLLTLTMACGYSTAQIGRALRPGEGMAGRVFMTGQPLIVEDYEQWEGAAAGFFSPPYASELAAPLRWRERCIGSLILLSDTRMRRLSEKDIRPAILVSNLASAAIENSRLYERLQASLTQLRRTLELEISERTAELARTANALDRGAGREPAQDSLGIDDLLGRVMELKIAKKVLGQVTNLPAGASAMDDLTPREIEVLKLLARGRSNNEIANELTLALSTVKFHVGNILGKLHQTDRTQAALWAVRQGLAPRRETL